MTQYNLHDLFTIQVNNPPKIFNRLNMFESTKNNDPDITVNYDIKPKPPSDKTLFENTFYRIGEDSIYSLYRHKLSFWKINITGLSDKDLPITINFTGDPFFASELFLQLVIEPLLTYTLPMVGALSLHASSVSYKDNGIVFTSHTGVGKTSILLNLLKDKQTTYYSDDQTLIKGSTLYPYPLDIGVRKHHLDSLNIKTTPNHLRKTEIFHVINKALGYYPNLTERIPVSELDFGNGFADYQTPDHVKLKTIYIMELGKKTTITDLTPEQAAPEILKQNHKNEDKLKILTSYFDLYNKYNDNKIDFWEKYNKQVLKLCTNRSVNTKKLVISKKYRFSQRIIDEIKGDIQNDL